MNISRLPYMLLAAALLAACDMKEPETPRQAGDRVPLQLTSGISMPATRAFDSSWEANDQIGVFTTVANQQTITMSGAQRDENIAYKITSGAETWHDSANDYKAFVPSTEGTQIYLPADGSDIDVYAYYPYTANVSESSPLALTIPASQNSASQKAVDLLKASALSCTSTIDIDHTTARLLFTHVLSKVLVKVKAGTGYSMGDIQNRVKVRLTGQPLSATFAPVSQTLAITSGSEDITPEKLGSGDPDDDNTNNIIHTFRALILPNTEPGGANPVTTDNTRQIVFTVGDDGSASTYVYNITQEFKPGYQTTFTLTLNATGIIVTAAITPWSEQSVAPETPLYEEE